jgi:hypothetical protein
MVYIYYEITIHIYKAIFPSETRLPPDPPAEGMSPMDLVGEEIPPYNTPVWRGV